ncbi:MAG: S8 family serine peptidase [Bacteroidaceae bacterium]|nr:S8 family serine peptidase [Bacteroidaceae bacterium]
MREENVQSIQRCYGKDIPTPTGRHFYVNLKSAEDLYLLEEVADQTGTTVVRKLPLGNWYSIETTTESVGDALACSNAFAETGLFEGVDPAFFMNIEPQATVTDTDYNLQWNLNDENYGINVENAWDYTKGNPNVKIAVFDGGIKKTHAEFHGTSFLETYDAYRNRHNDHIYSEHGTMVSSVISANHNYGKMAGIAPECSIFDICVPLYNSPSSVPEYRLEVTPENMIRGFRYAIDNGTDVINCSWGSNTHGNPFFSETLEQVIDSAMTYGRGGLGTIVVFASGNDNNNCNYPGNTNPNIIVTGALGRNGTRLCNNDSLGSNFGYELDIVAPGYDIYLACSLDTNTYENDSGTSFAAPQVSATAAMILSVAPQLSVKQVTRLITDNAKQVGPLTYPYDSPHSGHWNNQYGYGLLDVYHSLVKDYSNDNCNAEMIEGCFVNVTNTTVTGSFEVTTHTRAVFSGNFYVEGDCLFVVSGQDFNPE